ncbi:MAG: hypothetical protein AB1450_07685 [Pseudomonadota bacterium]
MDDRERNLEELEAELKELQALEQAAKDAVGRGDAEAAIAADIFTRLIARCRRQLAMKRDSQPEP